MSEITRDTYERIIKRYNTLDETKPEEIMVRLTEEKKEIGYKKLIMCAFLYKYRKTQPNNDIIEKYKEIIKELREKTNEKENEHKNRFEKIDLRKIRDDIKEDEYSIKNVIAGLYTLNDPRRLEDYALMRYVKTKNDAIDEKYNYYIEDVSIFYFQVYKTKKTYNKQEISVNEKLDKIIKGYIRAKGIKENTALLKYTNGTKKDSYSKKSLSNYLKDIFGGSVDAIRHSYITELYGNTPQLYKIEEVSKRMSHNPMTHLKYMDKDNVKVI